MSAPSHCKRSQIVSRALNASLFFGRVMRIELAVLTDNCEVHVRICATHGKKICCKIKFCKHERSHMKSCIIFYSALHAPTALVISICLSRMPKLFAKDEFLSLDFATNTLVNQKNSFYFHATKRIM